MSSFRIRRFGSKNLAVILLAGCMLSLTGSAAWATSGAASASATDHEVPSDFRVRLAQVLKLGQAKGPAVKEAKIALEQALMDNHPAVRGGAATALLALGDTSALTPLEALHGRESDPRAKSQMKRAIDKLKEKQAIARSSLFIQLGKVNSTDNALTQVLRGAIEKEAGRYATIVGEKDNTGAEQAKQKHASFLRLDGNLSSVTSLSDKGMSGARATVDFSVLRVPEQTLKGTLRGAATSRGVGTHSELAADAVRGAVESALRDSERSLRDAAK
jgi:hypothetical protein